MTPEDTAACFVQSMINGEFHRAWQMLSDDMQARQTPADLDTLWSQKVPAGEEFLQSYPRPVAQPDSPEVGSVFEIELQPAPQQAARGIAILAVHPDSRRVRSFMLA